MILRLINRNLGIFGINVLKTQRSSLYSMNQLLHTLSDKQLSNKTHFRFKCNHLVIQRHLSDKRQSFLMAFKPLILPDYWIKLKNWITVHTIIRPYFDHHFTVDDFINGSKQALVHISGFLAEGKLDSLRGLVDEEAMSEIRPNFAKLSAKQMQDLKVEAKDIIYSFVHTIGIIMSDNDSKRWVEITVVYYCLYKYQALAERPELSFQDFKDKFGPNITVCNYRFIRDYTKGVESDWTVNLLAHFTHQDLL